MWTKVIGYLFDKDNQRFMLLFALMGAIGFGIWQYNKTQDYKYEVSKQKNNIEALSDSVTTYKNEAEELTFEKLALQTDKEQLKTLNENLSDQLAKEKDQVDYLATINAELRADTASTDSVEIEETGEDSYKFNWDLSRQGEGWKRQLAGYLTMKLDSGVPYDPNLVVLQDVLNLQIVTGITTKDGKKRIFVRSPYPGLNVTNIEGAIIEDSPVSNPRRKSRFGIGPSIGVGYTTAEGIRPFLGISLNYNIFQF